MTGNTMSTTKANSHDKTNNTASANTTKKPLAKNCSSPH